MKKNLILVIGALYIMSINAQEIDVKWSDKQHYENKLDGFFEYFVGGNSKNIYAKFANLSLRKKQKKFKLVCFDKKTMKKTGDCVMMDLDDAKAGDYKGLIYYKSIVFENSIYVFWLKESKQKDELFVQSFDSQLKKLKPLKKIYELNASSAKNTRKPELFVRDNNKINEKILIGGEIATELSDDLKIEYKLMNNDLTFASSQQVTLPLKIKSRSDVLTSSYELGDDGNLHVKSFGSVSKEERKLLKAGEAISFSIYSVVDLNTGNIKSFPVKFDKKLIHDFNYIADKNSIKLVGFFSDLAKDRDGSDLHGIFYALIDNKSFTLENVNFSTFTPEQLNNLFSKDKEDRKDRKRLFQSKRKAKSEEESLASNYNIENIQSDKSDIILFCSRMLNYTTRHCNSKGSCTTYYYCEKNNITAFKINSDGKLLWASNLDRKITYPRWNVWDVDVVKEDGNYYVVYGSDFYTTAKKKNIFARKPKRYKEDNLEYAVFENSTGTVTRKDYKVNAMNAPKKERKSVLGADIQVMDNKLYINAVKVKVKLGWLIGGICGAVCIVPAYYVLLSGNTREGNGFLGIIDTKKK